jgi:hypothetical protein
VITKKHLAALGFKTSLGQHRRPHLDRVHKKNQRLALPGGRLFSIWGTRGHFYEASSPSYLLTPTIELGTMKLAKFKRLVAELQSGKWPDSSPPMTKQENSSEESANYIK